MALLSVENLRTCFHTRTGDVQAADGISFSLNPGKTLGIVGESGSGKTVSVYSLVRLIPMPPGQIESGTAWFTENGPYDGDLLSCAPQTLRAIRGNRISFIFQDPMTALNPFVPVGRQIAEPLLIHNLCSRKEAEARAVSALASVGISDPTRQVQAYPHQFSGGMRQRVLIAMALITCPALLIADEPTTALDVTVQAQILSLIKERQQALGMAVILITHNLGVVAQACDHVCIMYAGRIVESAPCQTILEKPRHPYTEALIQAMPSLHTPKGVLPAIPGMPPDLRASAAGCLFAPRCCHAKAACRHGRPQLKVLEPGHFTACLRVQEDDL